MKNQIEKVGSEKKEFTKIQIMILKEMLTWETDYSYGYWYFDCHVDKKTLKKEMRGLIIKGYVKIQRGGTNDDGELVGGTGFCLAYERRKELENIIQAL